MRGTRRGSRCAAAQPMPAQFTTVRSGALPAAAASTAAVTEASSDDVGLHERPADLGGDSLPCSSFRSATTTVLPAAASPRAVASPSPLAPPEMIAAVPFSSMAGSIPRRRGAAARRVRVAGRADSR